MPRLCSPRLFHAIVTFLTVGFAALGLNSTAAHGETPASRSSIFVWPGMQGVERTRDTSAPISTDRPSFTYASNTVGAGVTQIELGYTFSHDKSEAPRRNSHSFPEMELRQGAFADWLELRITQNGLISESGGGCCGRA